MPGEVTTGPVLRPGFPTSIGGRGCQIASSGEYILCVSISVDVIISISSGPTCF